MTISKSCCTFQVNFFLWNPAGLVVDLRKIVCFFLPVFFVLVSVPTTASPITTAGPTTIVSSQEMMSSATGTSSPAGLEKKDNSPSVLVIVLICVGVTVILLAVLIIIVMVCIHRRKSSKARTAGWDTRHHTVSLKSLVMNGRHSIGLGKVITVSSNSDVNYRLSLLATNCAEFFISIISISLVGILASEI